MLPDTNCFEEAYVLDNIAEVTTNFQTEAFYPSMNEDELKILASDYSDIQMNRTSTVEEEFPKGQIQGFQKIVQTEHSESSLVENMSFLHSKDVPSMEIEFVLPSLIEEAYFLPALPNEAVSGSNLPEFTLLVGTNVQIHNYFPNEHIYEVINLPDGQIGLVEPLIADNLYLMKAMDGESPNLSSDLPDINNPPTTESDCFINLANCETQRPIQLIPLVESDFSQKKDKDESVLSKCILSLENPASKSEDCVQEKCLIKKSKKQFQCKYESCKAILSSQFNKTRHETLVHGAPVSCPHCDKSLKPGSLGKHIDKVHNKVGKDEKDSKKKKIFRCNYEDCKTILGSHAIKLRHEKMVHILPRKCSYKNCGKFLKPSSVAYHVKKYHNKLKTSCDTNQLSKSENINVFPCLDNACDKTFSSKVKRYNHVSKTHRSSIKCPYKNCEIYVKPMSLRMHIQGKHEKVDKQCKICKDWIPINKFYFHLRKCSKEKERLVESESKENQSPDIQESLKKVIKKRQCKICKEWSSLCDLKKHFIICAENAGKTFVCTYKECFACFDTVEKRRVHLDMVHQPHVKCTYENCNAFIKPKCLTGHIKAKHEKLKKQCNNCNKIVSWCSFSAHFKRCTSNGQKNFRCTWEGCDSSFTTINNRFSHINYFHLNKKTKNPTNKNLVEN